MACFVCGRNQGRAQLWRSVAACDNEAGRRSVDEGRTNFEQGLSPCCAAAAPSPLNTPGVGTSSKALKLLHSRGLRLQGRALKRLPGLESLFLREDCSLERVEAARELTWGLCRGDRFPVLFRESGERAGVANIWLQEMGIPLCKAAPHVVVAHVGGWAFFETYPRTPGLDAWGCI